jgi:beta-galactosidase
MINKKSGALTSYEFNGNNLISSPLIPNFWRAPIDNDLNVLRHIPMYKKTVYRWKNAAKKRILINATVKQINQSSVCIITSSKIPNGKSTQQIIYNIFGTGEVVVRNFFTPKKNPIRFGMQMSIPKDFRKMTWFGRGPHETMFDRKSGASIGVYSGDIEYLIHNYAKPQENGNRTDVRWVAFTDKNGTGLFISDIGGKYLNVSAWPYSMEDLEKATHINKLPRRNYNTVNIDFKQRGVGGDRIGILDVLEKYKLKGKINYSYSFLLRWYTKDMGDFNSLITYQFPSEFLSNQ